MVTDIKSTLNYLNNWYTRAMDLIVSKAASIVEGQNNFDDRVAHTIDMTFHLDDLASVGIGDRGECEPLHCRHCQLAKAWHHQPRRTCWRGGRALAGRRQ